MLLPVGILLATFGWLLGFFRGMISPLTELVMARSELQQTVAEVMVVALLIGACFAIGLFVRNRWGQFIHETLEKRILKAAPGYSLIKETVLQFLGNRPSPFSSVALARIFGNETLVTAFVTESHDNGWFTVFVPTGPNPTSGNIFHLRPEYVHHIDLPVEDVMRSIISCGAGSDMVVKAYLSAHSGGVDSSE